MPLDRVHPHPRHLDRVRPLLSRHLDRVREWRDPPTSFGAYLVIADPKGAQIGRGISPLAPLGRDDVAVMKALGRDDVAS